MNIPSLLRNARVTGINLDTGEWTIKLPIEHRIPKGVSMYSFEDELREFGRSHTSCMEKQTRVMVGGIVEGSSGTGGASC